MSDPSVTCSIKRFCRRCKAHSFKVAVHSACPFRNCQCRDCSKFAPNNEVARERARKRRADQTAALTLIPTSTDIPVTVQQVLQLGKNNSQVDQDRKRLLTSALQAGTYQLNLKCNYFLLLQMRVFCLSTFGKTVLSLKIWILLVYELHIHVPCKNFGQTFCSISLLVLVVDIYAGCAAKVRFWLLSSCATFCLV